ncbi:hypothetical protein K2Z83_15140 [Oscillochloris sp. ZM17-4]|uniref:hypothetical protein n=1 Tax=Oscillochloris sp. ZM17-4 TaxID=2866714 RepID=UPI001C72E211|nr:hypothetical protein [Oscillochloris sp. ZM17-4]MBX0329012.1 hypothetical protein [Oscillochloris sp. ZM17-4]
MIGAGRVGVNTARQIHEAVLGFKDQVGAQYGPDSRAVELVGYIRKPERKKPRKRKATAAVWSDIR